MSTRTASAGDIKEGSYIMIDNVPCRVVEVGRVRPVSTAALRLG